MKDCIVVGAGILGASAAYHLVKQGASVTLIDRNDIGQATNAAAGIICPWLTNRRNKTWYQLVLEGAKYYPELIKELEAEGETDTGYARVGAINIFDTEKKLNKKMEFALERKKQTPEMGQVTKLSPTETRRLFPPLSEEYGAVHVSGGARVNGAALRDALVRNASRNGMDFIRGEASLLIEGEKIIGVKVKGERLLSNKVIIAGGAWARTILEPLGVKFMVTPQKAQIIHLQMPNINTSTWPVVMPPFNQYMLTFGSGKIVLGTTHEDQAGFDNRVTMGGVHEIINKALKVAPGLASSTYVETKVGFRPFTPGSFPVIGRIPGISGLYAANGLGASGLTSGPFIGSELAKLTLGYDTKLNLGDYQVSQALL